MTSSMTLAAFMRSLLSQLFTAADIEYGDGHKNDSRRKKNDIEHMLFFLD
jgi:hypothetical protein